MITNKILAATFTQLSRLYSSLSAEDVEAIVAGTAKVAVVRPDQRIVDASQRVVDASPIVDLALRAARTAKPDDVLRSSMGGSSFKLVHRGGKVIYPVDTAEMADQISQLQSEEAIISFLGADNRLKANDLRKIGSELGISTPAIIKKPEDLIAHIARSLAAFGS